MSDFYENKIALIHTRIIELSQSENIDRLELFNEIKKFMHTYIENAYSSSFDYDVILYEKLFQHLHLLTTSEQKQVVKSIIRRAVQLGSNELKNKSKDKYYKITIREYMENISFKNFHTITPTFVFRLATMNYYTTLALILILYIAISIFLLPFEWPTTMFRITYHQYTNYFILNHFLNIAAYLFSIDKNIEILPIHWIGVLTMIVAKIFAILFVLNLIIQHYLERIKENDGS